MCVVKKHKSHDFHELTEVASKLKSQVEQALLQTRRSKDEVMKVITQVEKRIQEIKYQVEDATSTMQKSFAETRSKLNEREAELTNQLKCLSSQYLSTLHSQLESLKKVVNSAKHQCQVTTTFVYSLPSFV